MGNLGQIGLLSLYTQAIYRNKRSGDGKKTRAKGIRSGIFYLLQNTRDKVGVEYRTIDQF